MTQQGHGNMSPFTNLGYNKDTFTKICILKNICIIFRLEGNSKSISS